MGHNVNGSRASHLRSLCGAGLFLSMVYGGCDSQGGAAQRNSQVPSVTELSSILQASAGRANSPSIAVDLSGRPVVVWSQEGKGEPSIYLQRWMDSNWADLGGSNSGRGLSNTFGGSLAPWLVVDLKGRPVVAWQDQSSGNYEIYLRRWNGSSWEELQQSATDGGISRTLGGLSVAPTLALDGSGNPVVAWEERFGSNSDVYIRRYTCRRQNCRWEDVGGKSGLHGGMGGKVGRSAFPSLALDMRDHPVLAWQDSFSGPFQIYVRRWTGSRWEEIGGSAAADGISRSKGAAVAPSLVLDSAGGPIIAWQDQFAGRDRIYLAHWNGQQWEGWAGSNTGEGISASQGGALPSLALDSGGRPVVGFQSEVGGQSRIFVRRWEGSAWQPWPGTAEGLVLQPGANAAQVRIVAAAASGICMVWQETKDQERRIAVRCLR